MTLKTKLLTLDLTLMMIWVFTASVNESQALSIDGVVDNLTSLETDPRILSYDTQPDHIANSCCCGDCAAQLVDQL